MVQEFERCGLSQTAFCAQRDINPKYFSLRQAKLLAVRQSTAFVAAVPTQGSVAAMATLHYRQVSVEIPSHDTPAIVGLIKALA